MNQDLALSQTPVRISRPRLIHPCAKMLDERRWYAPLRGLSPVQGASVQLSVPVLTALAGTIALGETVTTRLSLCSITILGGIALVIAARPNARYCSSVATAEDAKRT